MPLSSASFLATRLVKVSTAWCGELEPLGEKMAGLYGLNLGTREAGISGEDEVTGLISGYTQTGAVDKPSVHCRPYAHRVAPGFRAGTPHCGGANAVSHHYVDGVTAAGFGGPSNLGAAYVGFVQFPADGRRVQ